MRTAGSSKYLKWFNGNRRANRLIRLSPACLEDYNYCCLAGVDVRNVLTSLLKAMAFILAALMALLLRCSTSAAAVDMQYGAGGAPYLLQVIWKEMEERAVDEAGCSGNNGSRNAAGVILAPGKVTLLPEDDAIQLTYDLQVPRDSAPVRDARILFLVKHIRSLEHRQLVPYMWTVLNGQLEIRSSRSGKVVSFDVTKLLRPAYRLGVPSLTFTVKLLEPLRPIMSFAKSPWKILKAVSGIHGPLMDINYEYNCQNNNLA